ncbi:MAG TPA: restriction endonuclease [Gemmataceae bacterium]|nr:restriction endonuclease [Gemmataceae bacterium]
MTSQQYEELCRFFIADQLHLDISQVVSRTIANPRREPGPDGSDPEPYTHQIDLYWETGDGLAQYVNIANAKWRGHNKVRQYEVLLLQKVREKVGAHKAFMITNSGFTGRAQQVAEDEGIGLLIVRPQFNSRSMHRTRRGQILEYLQDLARQARPIYIHDVLRKGVASDLESAESLRQLAAFSHSEFAELTGANQKLPSPISNEPADPFYMLDGSGGPGASLGTFLGCSRDETRQGDGPGFRTK